MYRCSNCHKTFDKKYTFCPYCGAKLVYEENPVPVQANVTLRPIISKRQEVPYTRQEIVFNSLGYGIGISVIVFSLLFAMVAALFRTDAQFATADAFDTISKWMLVGSVPGLVFSVLGCMKNKHNGTLSVLGIVFNIILIMAAVIVLSIWGNGL